MSSGPNSQNRTVSPCFSDKCAHQLHLVGKVGVEGVEPPFLKETVLQTAATNRQLPHTQSSLDETCRPKVARSTRFYRLKGVDANPYTTRPLPMRMLSYDLRSDRVRTGRFAH